MDYQKYMDGGYQGYMDYQKYYHKYMKKSGNFSDHSNHMAYRRYMKFANCMRQTTKKIQNSSENPERDNTSHMAAYTKCKKIINTLKASFRQWWAPHLLSLC